MNLIANLIATLIETPSARRARLSREHAERRLRRLERAALDHINQQIARNLRDSNPYPFHA